MQKLFTKKIFILIILLFASSIYSQTEKSKALEESLKSKREELNAFYEEYIPLLIKFQNLTDYDKLYSDVKTILKNENINIEDLDDYLYKTENFFDLYYVKIYSYTSYIDDDKCNYIDKKEIIIPSLAYVCTIGLGRGIAPMANLNGVPLNIVYSQTLIFDEKIAVTYTWWDAKMLSGKFIFVNTDGNLNFLHDFVEFTWKE
jgi:hypothetical protein